MTGWRMPNARVPFLEIRGGCGCARVYGLPIFILFLRSITRPLAREEERLAHVAEPAGGRSEAEEKREKNGTSGVAMGAATSLRMTRTAVFGFWIWVLFWIFIYVRST
jgi:hypothetical protein